MAAAAEKAVKDIKGAEAVDPFRSTAKRAALTSAAFAAALGKIECVPCQQRKTVSNVVLLGAGVFSPPGFDHALTTFALASIVGYQVRHAIYRG